MAEKGYAELRAQIISTIKTNINQDISGNDIQVQLVDSLDSLYKLLYNALVAYKSGQLIIYNNGGKYEPYMCISDTSAGENPLSTPSKWNILSTLINGVLYGGSGASDNLTLASTANAIKGYIIFGSGLLKINETNSSIIYDEDSAITNNEGVIHIAANSGGLDSAIIFEDTDASTTLRKLGIYGKTRSLVFSGFNDDGTNEVEVMSFAANIGGVVFNNDQSSVLDFVIRGDVETNLLYVNVGSNKVGIGTSTPDAELEVVGTTKAATLNLTNVPVYANNAAALLGGLNEGDIYKTASTGDAQLMITNAT